MATKAKDFGAEHKQFRDSLWAVEQHKDLARGFRDQAKEWREQIQYLEEEADKAEKLAAEHDAYIKDPKKLAERPSGR